MLGFTSGYHPEPGRLPGVPCRRDLGCGKLLSPCGRSQGMQRGCHVHNVWIGLWIVSARARDVGKRGSAQVANSDLAEVWARSLDGLADLQIQPHQRAWLKLTRPLGLVENTALIATPNEFVKEQLETRLRALITHALSRELGRSIQLAVTVDPAATAGVGGPPRADAVPPAAGPVPPAGDLPVSAADQPGQLEGSVGILLPRESGHPAQPVGDARQRPAAGQIPGNAPAPDDGPG